MRESQVKIIKIIILTFDSSETSKLKIYYSEKPLSSSFIKSFYPLYHQLQEFQFIEKDSNESNGPLVIFIDYLFTNTCQQVSKLIPDLHPICQHLPLLFVSSS